MSDAKKTIEINDRATAKAVAERVGVKWPVAQGKPPLSALWHALDKLGFEVTGTYVPKPKPKVAPVPAGKREYEITRTHKGKPNSKGERTQLAKPETIRVSIGELREILASHGPGSLGDSRIREAISKLREANKLFVGWEDQDIAKASIVPVVQVDAPDSNALAALDAVLAPAAVEQAPKPAAKAPSTARKPRNSRAKAQDTTKVPAEPAKAAEVKA